MFIWSDDQYYDKSAKRARKGIEYCLKLRIFSWFHEEDLEICKLKKVIDRDKFIIN